MHRRTVCSLLLTSSCTYARITMVRLAATGLLLAACVAAAPTSLDARAEDILAASLLQTRDLPIDPQTAEAIAQQSERGFLDGLFNNKYTNGPAIDVSAASGEWAQWAHYQA